MNVINVTPGMSSLLLGKQGENKSTKFLFDVSGWLEEYPGCTITLVNRRPYESVSYPCVLTTEDDGKRGWVINSADLAKDGDGEAELKCTLGDMIEKERKTWKTKIVKSLSGEGDAPEPWESVMDDIEALVGDAQDARDDAEDAAEDSEAYAVGKRGGEDVGSTDPAYHNNSKYYAEQAAALLDTKADKVSGATNGNFAGLDSNGNLMDSGKKSADFYELPGTGIPKSDLSSGVQSSLELADSAYQKPGTGIPAEDIASGVIPDVSGYYTKPSGGIPKTDLASEVQTSLGKADTAYQKDSGGIPSTDMTTVVQTSLGKADTAYQKPSGGIPSSDMATAVQTSLGKADTAYQKPGTGIPASDIESGVIPVMTDLIDDTAGSGDTDKVWSADKSHELLTEINSKADKTVTDALQIGKAPVIIDSATGNPIVLTDGADGLQIDGMKIHFLPVQSGTGDPSTSNVRPISGWQGMTAYRSGKNLLDKSKFTGNKSVWWQGNVIGGYAGHCVTPKIPVKPGASYFIKRDTRSSSSGGQGYVSLFGKDESYITQVIIVDYGQSFTMPDDVYYIGLTIGTEYVDEAFMCFSQDDTQYADFTALDSYSVTFPEVVYGGTLDAVSGVLTVEWVKRFERWGDMYKPYETEDMVEGVIEINHPIAVAGDPGGFGLYNFCNVGIAEWSGLAQTKPHYYTGFSTGDKVYRAYIFLPQGTSNDLQVEIVSKIKDPYEIPIDPITVQTLIGDNTIWSDANGTIELDYRADTKLFIAKQKTDIRATIAPIEDGATASQAYSAGKFFYHDGQFCKAKTSIATGATFTLNTNYQITTVADELFALN